MSRHVCEQAACVAAAMRIRTYLSQVCHVQWHVKGGIISLRVVAVRLRRYAGTKLVQAAEHTVACVGRY